jgi:aquaporin Z
MKRNIFHWQEYLIEGAGLGIFTISAGTITTLIESPVFPIYQMLPEANLRRMAIAIAMGLTAIAIIYSPWGKRSGAHINPAVTLTFFRLGKITSQDALFYIIAQFIGGLSGIYIVAYLFPIAFTEPPINYIVTVPGKYGTAIAALAEFSLAFILMLTILSISNNQRFSQFTGLIAGLLVTIYITLEAPISGMSINPARTFASALPANIWTDFWLYYFGPSLGMLFAAEIYIRYFKTSKTICGKLCPNQEKKCLFHPCCCDKK